MSNHAKKLLSIILILLVSLSCINVSAEDQKLYEKYGYQENYSYYKDNDGAIIGHALKSTVAKIYNLCAVKVTYPVVTLDKTKVQEYKTSSLESGASEESINEYVLTNLSQFLNTSKSDYTEGSFGATGSGVVISDNGYIATNAHVVDDLFFSEDEIISNVASDVYFIYETDVTNALSELGISCSSYEDGVSQTIWDVITQRAVVTSSGTQYSVRFASPTGNTSSLNAIDYQAKLIYKGTSQGRDGLTKDAAILKIDASNLVSLKLSPDYPESNSALTAAGFPSASEYIFINEDGTSDSELSPTITSGSVARPVSLDDSRYKAIETTVQISGGNSGGPSVDNNLNVEGLNTYGLTADMRYAYMIPSAYLNELASSITLVRGESTLTFLTGLQMLHQNHGKAALECFERVKELQPKTPYIQNLIASSQAAPQTTPIDDEQTTPEENTQQTPQQPKKSGFSLSTPIIIAIIAGVLLLASIIIVIILVRRNKKNKSKNPSEISEKDNPMPHVLHGESGTTVPKVATPPVGTPHIPHTTSVPASAHRPEYTAPTNPYTPPTSAGSTIKSTFKRPIDESDLMSPPSHESKNTPPAQQSGTSGLKMSKNFKEK